MTAAECRHPPFPREARHPAGTPLPGMDDGSELDAMDASLTAVEAAMKPFTDVAMTDLTAQLPPAERARLQVSSAYAVAALTYTLLRVQGVDAARADAPIKGELERVKTYMQKVNQVSQTSAAGSAGAGAGAPDMSGRTMSVDAAASKRMVEAALDHGSGGKRGKGKGRVGKGSR